MLDDQKQLLSALNAHDVKYLVIGGHAVSLYAEPRGTKDLDVFIKSDMENSVAVYRALAAFGAPLTDVTPAYFVDNPEGMFQVGVQPARVDIMSSIAGVDFDDAWERRVEALVAEGVSAHWISKEDLIRNKLASARFQDLADVEKIRKAERALQSK